MENQPDNFRPHAAKPSAGLNDPSNLVLPADLNSIGKLKLREKKPTAARPTAIASANPPPPDPAPVADAPATTSPVETTQSVSVEELLGMPVATPQPAAPETDGMLIKPGVSYTTYRFKGHGVEPPSLAEMPAEQPAAVVATDSEDLPSRAARNVSMAFFLVGNLLLTGAMVGFRPPWGTAAWQSLGAVLAAQLLFMALCRAASPGAGMLARTMVGAFTLFAALAAVGLVAMHLFVAPCLLSSEMLGNPPHPGPIAAAAFVFAASLTLVDRASNAHWGTAVACLVAATAATALPIGDLAAFYHPQNILAKRPPPSFTPPADWLAVASAPPAKSARQQLYRHRQAPLELTIARLAESDFDGSDSALEKLADQLKSTLSLRPGTTVSLIAKVNGKPHQRRLVNLTNERKTAVLMVGTKEGILTLTVEAKRDIFERHESHVTSLFAAVD